MEDFEAMKETNNATHLEYELPGVPSFIKDDTIFFTGNSSYLYGGEVNFSDYHDLMSIFDTVRFGRDVRGFLITLYAITTLLALVGNLIVVVTLAAGTSFWKLRHFLINLAVSDLLISIFCLPFTSTEAIFGKWHFGEFMCPFVSFMQYLAVSVCAFTNVAIGLDRYWAVVRPMLARLPTGRVRLVITIVWLFGFAVSSPQLVVSRQKFKYPTGNQCVDSWASDGQRRIYLGAVLTITYLIPFFILTLTYCTVGLRLWERTHPGEAYTIRDQRQRESKKKVIKMLLTIVIAFGLCWLPLHLFHILIEARPDLYDVVSEEQENAFISSFIACHWISMAHSCVNPIIYGFLHEKFRKDVRVMLRTCFRCRWRVRSSSTSVSRGFHPPTDTHDTTDRGSPYRSRRPRSSSTNSSNRSRTGTFSLGCGLRRQDTVEDYQGNLPHRPPTDHQGPPTSITCRCSNNCQCGVTSV